MLSSFFSSVVSHLSRISISSSQHFVFFHAVTKIVNELQQAPDNVVNRMRELMTVKPN